MSEFNTDSKCHNCGRPIPYGALFCGQCGSKRKPPNTRADSTTLVFVGLIFMLCGVPAGGFGACMGLAGFSSLPRYPAEGAGFLVASVVGLGVFGWTVMNMVNTANKR